VQVIEHDAQHPLTDEMKDAIREQAFDGWLRGEREVEWLRPPVDLARLAAACRSAP